MFTDREKWQAAARELHMRLRVYPNWVASGRMTQQLAYLTFFVCYPRIWGEGRNRGIITEVTDLSTTEITNA